MKVVLLGYMASGKSAVGKLLAKELNIQFVDLDDFIEKKEQLSISEIFKLKGEIYFRIKEGEYLKELLNFDKNLIISLGGGTPCYGNNMEIIKNKSKSFYLNASINTIYERLIGETSKRPLVATLGTNNLKEFIAKHLFERNQFYERSDNTILVNNKSISEVSKEIMTFI
ncbi:shikimate kinase [Lutibacter maritimus]|uniref:Shikimate kinase n=1 Tax=Lutibacter maritimus TaxID=593133 RepID=A0A1I6NZ02_9FLAO|nr:shikimate kinase [Lutibacter maritimus]SFS33184.1 shikimate kinase [Lutibacter maritimus]